MTSLADLEPKCGRCGQFHLFERFCRFDLHGEEDPFKTSCATCGETIESNAPRETDGYGNLYCCEGCAATGLRKLLEGEMDR